MIPETAVTEPPRHRAWKFWVRMLFCFLHVAVGLLALGFLLLRAFSVAGCGQGCDAVGLGYTLCGFAIFGFAVTLASIVLLVLLRARTWAWMIPGVAVLIIIVGFFITDSAVDKFLLK